MPHPAQQSPHSFPACLFRCSCLLLALILLSACDQLPFEIEIIRRTTPTPPPAPTVPPPPPTPTFVPVHFRDDFDGALTPGWYWMGEDPSAWNLTEAPGSLRIYTERATAREGDPINFLFRSAPQGDFEITTFLRFEPYSNYQFAGLIIYEKQGSAVQFGRGFAICASPTLCDGNSLYFNVFASGTEGLDNFAYNPKSRDAAYLRLRRHDNTYTAFYSPDGEQWIETGVHTSRMTPVYAGLISAQGDEGEAAADFDYFTLDTLP